MGEPEEEIKFATLSSRMISAAPQDDDPHLTNRMLAWIEDPYFANHRPVNYVPPAAEPVDQHPDDNSQHSDQHQSPQQPTPTASTSSSSAAEGQTQSDHQSPPSAHQSAERTATVQLDDVQSGNTISLHLS